MKTRSIATAVAVLVLAITLGACGKGTLSTNMTNEGAVEIVAKEADIATTTTAGSITVDEGQCIVISPVVEEGFIRVTIETGDGKVTVYDKDVTGTEYFTVDADPGIYDVVTAAENATGHVVILTADQAKVATPEQVAQVFSDAGVKPEYVEALTSK